MMLRSLLRFRLRDLSLTLDSMTYYNRQPQNHLKNKKCLHNHPNKRTSKWNWNRVMSPPKSQFHQSKDKSTTLVSAASANQVWCPNTPARSETLTMPQAIWISWPMDRASQKVIYRLPVNPYSQNSSFMLNPHPQVTVSRVWALSCATMTRLLSVVKTLTRNLLSTILLSSISSSRDANWLKKSCILKYRISFREKLYNSTRQAR